MSVVVVELRVVDSSLTHAFGQWNVIWDLHIHLNFDVGCEQTIIKIMRDIWVLIVLHFVHVLVQNRRRNCCPLHPIDGLLRWHHYDRDLIGLEFERRFMMKLVGHITMIVLKNELRWISWRKSWILFGILFTLQIHLLIFISYLF